VRAFESLTVLVSIFMLPIEMIKKQLGRFRSNKEGGKVSWWTSRKWCCQKIPNFLWVVGTWDQAPSADCEGAEQTFPIHTGHRIHSRNVRMLRFGTTSGPIVGAPSGRSPWAQPRRQCGGHELFHPVARRHSSGQHLAGGDYALGMLLK